MVVSLEDEGFDVCLHDRWVTPETMELEQVYSSESYSIQENNFGVILKVNQIET